MLAGKSPVSVPFLAYVVQRDWQVKHAAGGAL